MAKLTNCSDIVLTPFNVICFLLKFMPWQICLTLLIREKMIRHKPIRDRPMFGITPQQQFRSLLTGLSGHQIRISNCWKKRVKKIKSCHSSGCGKWTKTHIWDVRKKHTAARPEHIHKGICITEPSLSLARICGVPCFFLYAPLLLVLQIQFTQTLVFLVTSERSEAPSLSTLLFFPFCFELV